MTPTGKKRLALLFLLLVVSLMLFSLAVEAATLKENMQKGVGKIKGAFKKVVDWIKKGFAKIRPFITNKNFWLNIATIAGAALLIFFLFLQNRMGSGSSSTVLIILLILGAVVGSFFIVDESGQPVWLISQTKFRHATQFLIGPAKSEQMGACPDRGALGSAVQFVKDVAGVGGEPPCCGRGAYKRTYKGETKCKQAILIPGDNGAGLPAFLVASIIFYILFNYLLKDKVDNKWVIIIMSVLLGAMLANERVTKNQILVIVGWVLLFIFGPKLAKQMGKAKEGGKGGDDKTPTSMSGSFMGTMFGFAVVYAAIQLALNILGTSLWGGSVGSGGVGVPSIIKNLLFGCIFGSIYASATGEIAGMWWDKMGEDRKKRVQERLDEGDYWGAIKTAYPGYPAASEKWERLKTKLKAWTGMEDLEEESDKNLSNIERLISRREQLNDQIVDELTKDTIDAEKLGQLRDMQKKIVDEIEKQDGNAQRRRDALERLGLL